MIKLLVGLGNPGPQYASTRHNAGFWWIDALANDLKTTLGPDKNFHGLLGTCRPDGLLARSAMQGQAIWLLKPQTLMNLSGKSVAALARFFKVAPQEILVAHDELDLAAGEVKLKFGGGHAGHNGLRDIHAQLGCDQYWRLRLGIGHPGVKAEVSNWVLQKPSPEQRLAIDQGIARARQTLPALLNGEMERAMLLLHTRKAPRAKPAPPGSHAAPKAL